MERHYLKILSILGICFLCLGFLASCGGGGTSSTALKTALSMVSLSVDVPGQIAKNMLAAHAKSAIPSIVSSITFTISAPDITTITKTDTVSGQSSITEAFSVPSGDSRHFEVDAYDSSGKLVYTGSTTADLNGSAVTLNITMATPSSTSTGTSTTTSTTTTTTTSTGTSTTTSATTTIPASAASANASGTYTYSSGTVALNTANSTFPGTCGPTLGTESHTGVTITSTTMTWPSDSLTWTMTSGTPGSIVGTWTATESNGNSYTATFNANGTWTVTGNIASLSSCTVSSTDLSDLTLNSSCGGGATFVGSSASGNCTTFTYSSIGTCSTWGFTLCITAANSSSFTGDYFGNSNQFSFNYNATTGDVTSIETAAQNFVNYCCGSSGAAK